MPALALENVEVTFPGRQGPYTAIRDTTLHVAQGEFLSVVGPTGCGKSTLLNLAAGLLAPTSGTIHVRGHPLAGINRQAGYLFQTDSLMPWRSALDNVAAGPSFAGTPRTQARAQAETDHDCRVTPDMAATVKRALSSFDPAIAAAPIDLDATHTDRFLS